MYTIENLYEEVSRSKCQGGHGLRVCNESAVFAWFGFEGVERHRLDCWTLQSLQRQSMDRFNMCSVVKNMESM